MSEYEDTECGCVMPDCKRCFPEGKVNMNPDKMIHCYACGIDYEVDDGDCPSCNPEHTYYIMRMVADGPDDYTWELDDDFDKNEDGYWSKHDAISDAKAVSNKHGYSFQIVDERGHVVEEVFA